MILTRAVRRLCLIAERRALEGDARAWDAEDAVAAAGDRAVAVEADQQPVEPDIGPVDLKTSVLNRPLDKRKDPQADYICNWSEDEQ